MLTKERKQGRIYRHLSYKNSTPKIKFVCNIKNQLKKIKMIRIFFLKLLKGAELKCLFGIKVAHSSIP